MNITNRPTFETASTILNTTELTPAHAENNSEECELISWLVCLDIATVFLVSTVAVSIPYILRSRYHAAVKKTDTVVE